MERLPLAAGIFLHFVQVDQAGMVYAQEGIVFQHVFYFLRVRDTVSFCRSFKIRTV